MNWLKKFWITFISFLPLSAGAFNIFAVGGGLIGGGILGYSIYRSVSPVNLSDAFSFFSSCWSCQVFSDIVGTMSSLLPPTYKHVGEIMIPLAIILTAIWFALEIVQIYTTPKKGVLDGWSISGKFGSHIVKLLFVGALLAVPLPKMISSVVIEPAFNVGLSMNYAISMTDARQTYANCVIATAVADRASINAYANNSSVDAFSPRFRHNLTCQVANIHQMTGFGMTVGWTMLNMAFNTDYMHTIMWDIPVFPNVLLIITGLAVFILYLAALLPIPLYFMEIFVKLSIDLILLPITLLGWLFKDWKIFNFGQSNVQKIIEDVVSGTLGLAMTGIFITFSITVLNAVFGDSGGLSVLQQAFIQNDSRMLMDGLMSTTGSKSLVTIVLIGIFMVMFMVMIPALIKSLFNVTISDEYYQTAKKDVKTFWDTAKKFWQSAKK